MKTTLLICTFTCASFLAEAQNTDLPNPTANLQTLPAGSYVIAMDNTLQVNSSGDFNLKTYGLIVYLLNNNVKLKWSIKAGKAKDGIDFTALAEQLKPTLAAGGVSRDFKAGPFVINATDTTGVGSLIDAYYTSNALTGLNRPLVYRLTSPVSNADIRYDMTGFKPKAAILTDGGNEGVHIAYMTAASIPTANYATSAGTDLLVNCYTFASEPHNSKTGPAVDAAISAIKNFTLNGGNFLAQCAAVDNYENNALGHFQSTGGITVANVGIGTNLSYPNPDLSFSQFDGAYDASQGGSFKNWKIVGSTINSEHNHATGTGGNSNVIGASVSKMATAKGGLVFYIGNHSFATTSLGGINGIRMYMNAFLTPTVTCPAAGYQSSILPVRLVNFSGTMENSANKLKWSIEDNGTAKQFEVERSSNGNDFSTCGIIFGTNKAGYEEYAFSEHSKTEKTFYRIKMIDQNGKQTYSSIICLKSLNGNDVNHLTVSNPIKDDLVLYYSSTNESVIATKVYNSLGALIYSAKMNCFQGANQVIVPASFFKARGVFTVEVIDNNMNRQVSRAIKL